MAPAAREPVALNAVRLAMASVFAAQEQPVEDGDEGGVRDEVTGSVVPTTSRAIVNGAMVPAS
jgi:hypothetical protein